MSKRNVGRGLNAVSDGRNPQRPGSRLRKNAPPDPVRAARLAENKRKREAKLAAAAARGRAEAHAEWVREVKKAERVEERRQKRIKSGGLRVADVQEVVDLARNMCGGIGPAGIAKTGTVRVVGEELKRRVREAAHRQRLTEIRETSRPTPKRTDQEDNFVQGMALVLAELNRKFDQPTMIVEILREAGLDDLDELRKAGVDKYDLDEIAKCLPNGNNVAKRMSRALGRNIIAKNVE